MKSFFSFLLQFSSSLFLSFRPLNLFLIILTQVLVYVFLLNNSLCFSKLFYKHSNIICVDFYLLLLITSLSAAAGYILNDGCDRKIDLINSPKRAIFTEKNLSFLYFLSSLFFSFALFYGFVISFQIGIFVFFSVFLLIFYAKYSKKIGIFKSIIVSLLTAFSILLVGLLYSFTVTIFLFSVWAFLLSMIREIIKDFEDFEGDSIQNSFTSVIQLGRTKSILLLNFLSILLVLSILISAFIYPITIYNSAHKILMVILIGIFITFLTNQKFNFTKVKYKKLSLFCKIMMLVGILGMIVY